VSNNHTPKFQLKLNEENELDFKLSIEGSVSDQDMAKPVFRFVMTENNSDKGWVFPVRSKYKGSDIFTVKIPALNENVQENSLYSGRLEVIMGNVLMVPTEVMMEFKRPIGVRATPISTPAVASTKTKSPEPHVEEVAEQKQTNNDVIEEEIDAIIAAAPPKQQIVPPATNKTKSPILFGNVMNFLEEEVKPENKKTTIRKTVEEKQDKKPVKKSEDKEVLKSQLLNMFRTALK
jgi:hypothetical protein